MAEAIISLEIHVRVLYLTVTSIVASAFIAHISVVAKYLRSATCRPVLHKNSGGVP